MHLLAFKLYRNVCTLQAVKAAVNVLKGGKLNAKDIKAGRAALRNHILTEFENGTASAESLAAQGLYTGVAKTSVDLANDVNAISDNDVLSVSFLHYNLPFIYIQ